ncbi:hypothetical protein AU381_14145 [Sinorhizobium glycinis]|uniref:Uncharacterized protein n=1 Tax=Sinorhizobium glycinis TaxID=1472378 RepID=A0A178XRJ9_9HYPH|nr:hypothetical protein AU381_14145 [Sinorhizobium glycinis]
MQQPQADSLQDSNTLARPIDGMPARLRVYRLGMAIRSPDAASWVLPAYFLIYARPIDARL